tara:strand:- start:402 stop:896 length:495 start_codon:yes stop_codon:yes gene_type:complete
MKVITKISFKEAGEGGVDISYTNFDGQGLKDKTKKESPHQPHIAFEFAMKKLAWHMIFLCEFNSEEKFQKFETTEKENETSFRVCGVSISGEGEKEGVVITGYKTLSNGLGFVFNTPNTKFSSSEYKFMKNLISDIELLKQEAGEYLNGKYRVVQGDLFKKGEE